MCFLLALKSDKAELKQKVVIGYVGGFHGLININNIAAQKLTHINYAFVNIKNNRAFLSNESTDTVNLRKLNELKSKNPTLQILISIGGWTWSRNFSDAVLTDTSRRRFAASAVQIIRKFKLDGIDIDWEYPALPGDSGNVYRPEDKQNYTLLLQVLRNSLDSLQSQTKTKKLLTVAVGGFDEFLEHTEMNKAQKYLDFINLMTYDFYPDKVAIHHTNLYPSKKYKGNSADAAFKAYVAAGVPAGKLVIGVAFYSRAMKLKPKNTTGLGDSILSTGYGKGFTYIKDSLINRNGFKVYKDRKAKADYIYNPQTAEFMTFDDEYSVKEKCKYAKNHGMAGVMFWEYDSDIKNYLLDQINKTLK
ncbi:MAG: glycoside hydrolase family 18 protein [Sphingobacteriaceae bacterium]|nr:MAG: glycoside hydrolase family 18 protein [Sphingobacteriaceae bacterium]